MRLANTAQSLPREQLVADIRDPTPRYRAGQFGANGHWAAFIASETSMLAATLVLGMRFQHTQEVRCTKHTILSALSMLSSPPATAPT